MSKRMKQAFRVLRLFIFIILFAELNLRVFASILLSPRHLTHGIPAFVDFKAGIYKFGGNWGIQPVPRPIPGQTYRVPLSSGEIALARINNAGFRGADFSIQKSKGVIRIATMGASSTFGFGNRDDETYPHQLQEMLNIACPTITKFEVYNFGIPFMTSAGIASIYNEIASGYNPDLVTFYEGVNDTGEGPETTFSRYWDWMRSYSLIVEILNVPVIGYLQSYSQSDIDQGISQMTQEFIANVESIAKNSTLNSGAKFIVATQQAKSYIVPVESIKGVTYENEYQIVRQKAETDRVGLWALRFARHHELMHALRSWAMDSGFELVELQAALDLDRDYLTSWVHLNKDGNAIIARILADKITEKYCND